MEKRGYHIGELLFSELIRPLLRAGRQGHRGSVGCAYARPAAAHAEPEGLRRLSFIPSEGSLSFWRGTIEQHRKRVGRTNGRRKA